MKVAMLQNKIMTSKLNIKITTFKAHGPHIMIMVVIWTPLYCDLLSIKINDKNQVNFILIQNCYLTVTEGK